MMPEKKNPAKGGDLREETPLTGSAKTAPLTQRVERYGRGKTRSTQIANYLHTKNDLPKQREKLDNCANWLLFHHYYTIGELRLAGAITCKQHLLCGFCAMRRGAKYVEAYLRRLQIILSEYPDLQASMITLTVKNGHDLAERTDHIFGGLGRLNNRRRHKAKGGRSTSEWGKIVGLVGAYETTHDRKTGYHPHFHIFALHRGTFDFKALRREWRQITGDSHVFRIDPVMDIFNVQGEFVEIFKYALKISEMSPEKTVEAYKVLRGRRLVFSAGLFRGVKVPEDLKDELIDGHPYEKLFYRYLKSSGVYTYDKNIPLEVLTTMNAFHKDKLSASQQINQE